MSLLRTLKTQRELPDPSAVRFLLSNTMAAPLWTAIRLYVGWQWLWAGYEKINGTGWVDGGASLKGFWTRVIAVPQTGSAPIHYDWYRSFITFMLNHQWYDWFGKFVAWGELVVGIALIIGFFTGVAALGGALMNFNYMLAGSASTNPVLFGLAVLIILSWKVSGYIGVDRWLLPAIGTPWAPLPALRQTRAVSGGGAAPALHA
jgi:thiosulfate dehydrogenase (quinone) large subunit